MPTKNRIPERWLDYTKIGERIVGTPFIAFKVPLGENYFRKLPVDERFTISDVIDDNPGIKLIIDLTNTTKYYSSKAVEDKGVQYQKLSIPGKKKPPPFLANAFGRIVQDFLRMSVDDDPLIGVHCTHGVNRTGYMICYFMIRHLNMHPCEAICVFEAARGHSIERKEYVEALESPCCYNKCPVQGTWVAELRETLPVHNHAYRTGKTEVDKFGGLFRHTSSSAKWRVALPPAQSWRNHHAIPHGPEPASRRHRAAEPEAGPSWKYGSTTFREDPAYEGREWRRKKMHVTSSPQPKPQPLPRPSPQFPSAERSFGYGVERERGPGAGPAISRGGGGGGDGRGWSRARGGFRSRSSQGQRGDRQHERFDQHARGRGGRGRGRGRARRPWTSSERA